MSELNITNRPTWNDNDEMRKQLAEIVGKRVFDWCNEDGSDDTDLDDCIEIAFNILKYHSHDNGYEIAKEFENEGFSPDAILVEILDGVSIDKYEVQQKMVKEWVKENNLELDLEVGQKVITKFIKEGELECEIVQLYPETMEYGLWHKKFGYAKGKGNRLVNYENVSISNN